MEGRRHRKSYVASYVDRNGEFLSYVLYAWDDEDALIQAYEGAESVGLRLRSLHRRQKHRRGVTQRVRRFLDRNAFPTYMP